MNLNQNPGGFSPAENFICGTLEAQRVCMLTLLTCVDSSLAPITAKLLAQRARETRQQLPVAMERYFDPVIEEALARLERPSTDSEQQSEPRSGGPT
jgi:hypothetical protein